MSKSDPYDPPEWLTNWAVLHGLAIEEMALDRGWQLYARDGTPHVHCYADWSMQIFLKTLVNWPNYEIL